MSADPDGYIADLERRLEEAEQRIEMHPPCEHSPRWAGKDGTLWPCADPDCPSASGVETVICEDGDTYHRALERSPGVTRWSWQSDREQSVQEAAMLEKMRLLLAAHGIDPSTVKFTVAR